MSSWPHDLSGINFYLVGIKGTGMCAFAELLLSHGARVRGSDVEDTFYTDAILQSLGIPYSQGFSPANLGGPIDLVIHSAAYNPDKHPELLEARRLGLTILEYTQALGLFSSGLDSSGVCGVHGKTTTTALCGTLVKYLGLPGSILVGSGVSNFGNRSTLTQGQDFFIAETCEYRRHFLNFHPRRLILTSVEMDHQDYFKDIEDLYSAFIEYMQRLPRGGILIWCADDSGCREVVKRISSLRPDLSLVPYGFEARGDFRILDHSQGHGEQSFRLEGFSRTFAATDPRFSLRIPGRHTVLNAAAALALVSRIHTDRYGNLDAEVLKAMAEGLHQFSGSRRRSEIIGSARDVLVLDDYAHHPSAIKTTLEGYRSFYPGRRMVVDFMSHTWSRTRALLEEFAHSFGAADQVIIHDIYPSARETPDPWMTGERFRDHVKAAHPAVEYFPGVMDALPWLEKNLKPGDLFVTMGAGDNWKLGRAVLDFLKAGQE